MSKGEERGKLGQRLLKGTMTLVLAGLLSRILGAVYRIILPRIMGAEGVGLYHMAYHMYSLTLFLVTPGLPLAMSRLIAAAISREDWSKVRCVVQMGLFLLLILGTGGSSAFLGCGLYCPPFVPGPRVAYPLMVIAPALFFVGVISFFRGFFQGCNQMFPTASSQVLDRRSD